MDHLMLQKKFTPDDDDEFSKMCLLGQETGRFGYLFNGSSNYKPNDPPPLRGTKSQLRLGTDQDQGQASCLGSDVSVEFGAESSKVGISAGVPYLEMDCNPRVLLNNLVFLEQKVNDLQGVARSMIEGNFELDGLPDGLLMQQQMIRANITSIIAQLLSVASRLLPSAQQVNHGSSVAFGGGGGGHGKTMSMMSGNLQQIDDIRDIDEQMKGKDMEFDFSPLMDDDLPVSFFRQPTGTDLSEAIDRTLDETKLVLEEEIKRQGLNQVEKSVFPFKVSENRSCKDVDVFQVKGVMKEEEEEEVEEEELIPGTYELLELDKDEILAPHSHFCTICGKGFKRDANLRMHMRGHGDEYKTPEALAKPNKDVKPENTPVKRYSCPFAGCKRNQKYKKFQPLKTILCVKNHYKRSHCDKSYICSRCHSKKFSVLADLKTHEKHCGQDKWQCSCGTTFSRKDKLFGHVALFQGHTPAIPKNDVKPPMKTDEGSNTEKAKSLCENLPSNSEEGFANLNSSMKYENESSLLESDAIRCGINFSDEMRSSDLFTNGSSSIIQSHLQSTNGLPGDSFSLQALLSGNFSQPDGRSLNPNGL